MPLVINGEMVDDTLLEAEFGNIKAYFENQGNVSCCERDGEFRGYAKKNVIARLLLADEAVRRMPTPPDELIDAEVNRIKNEQGAAQFDFMAGAVPEHLENLKRDISLGLRVTSLLKSLVESDPEPTDEELRAFYTLNQAYFMRPEQVRALHISKNPGRGGDSREKIYETLCQVREQLLDGADFEALAREHSDKGAELIDLDFFGRGDLPEEFELVTFSMRIGELSPVFPSTHGLHIARVTDRRPAAAKPFEEVREDVRHRWTEQRKQLRTAELVEELQSKASIQEIGEEMELPQHS